MNAYTQIKDPISIIRISPNESLVAVAAKGVIYIFELHPDKKEKLLIKVQFHINIIFFRIFLVREYTITKLILWQVTEHKESEITALIWSWDNTGLFSGDDSGSVMGSSMAKARSFFFSADPIFKCDSRVVQLGIYYSKPHFYKLT